jgi:uncharacterized protein
MKNKKPPHYKVYTRLKPSKIHGVGVFAIRDIPKGVSLFADEAEQNIEDNWVDKKEVAKLDPEIQKLYADFSPITDDKYNCPKSYDLITVGYYVNHSPRPNVVSNNGGSFTTLRKIKKGEEITADFRTYSDEPPYKWLSTKLPKR